ncbi:CsgE family curli-type amyloid fiber assembly protein [Aquimarina hainanensis]|uniref:Curli production assembly/transport component CsgE n=1 Tax=Aquimarina hainanensis TaxID=1578017 RepID=A0ABW5NAQ5_9FLAO|nr:CsgE family curli-type amyloid fiber assembly protein [Aquimarina sp. TRL1]QKX03563.1 hypothetical protein HN014_01080 [Aquimarina sp. TRL1]
MKCIGILCALLMTASGWTQYANNEVVAALKQEAVADATQITAIATNTSEIYKSLRFSFSIFTTDENNVLTKNVKEGRFTVKANESIVLSNAIVANDETNKVVILVLIYDEDRIIGKDRVAFNEAPDKVSRLTDDPKEPEDGIELKGIVIEETKTKPGKDFYDFFYQSYLMNQINGNKVVGIYETLSFGRSTIIQVKIEETVLHEFLGKPDLEYLEEMSRVAIRKVYKYFKDARNQKKAIFQY